MSRRITQEEFNLLITAWAADNVLGIESLFNVKLTEQQKNLVRLSQDPKARVAVSSCTGSGKSACLSMMTFLYLMTLPDCRVLITSPSYNQLVRVFYAELTKWHKRMPEQFQEYFKITRERIDYVNTKKYLQFASLVTSSVENKESLQGGHAENYIILGDEASGISEEAFDILLGTLSTGEGGRFILASNPVRSSGRFYEIFNRDLGTWAKLFFSAHDSPNVNPEWILEMEETYGLDSDLYRMRVLGQFPRVGVAQFISSDIVEECVHNITHPTHYSNFPKVVGVDIARFGDDSTVFILRQGPKLLDFKVYKGLDTMEVAIKVAEFSGIHQPSRIYIDSIGIGAGTYDRCKQLGLKVSEVIVSNKSTEPNVYANLRSQLWGKMRDWLMNGADLPTQAKDKDTNLCAQLSSMEFAYNNKMQIQLLSKKDLKRMGHPSPDIADALALTFADSVYEGRGRAFVKRPVKKTRFMWT
jgi:hypothetical protein